MTQDKHIGMEQVAQTMTYGGGSTAFVAGLTLSEIGVIVGIIVGLTGLGFQIWFGLRRDARDREAHAKIMQETDGGS